MDNKSRIQLAFLHSGGFTHKDLEKIYNLGYNLELVAKNGVTIPWMSKERKEKILNKINTLSISNISETIQKKGINIITLHDTEYPARLKSIKQSPFMLYVRGILDERKLMLGIVGSRRNTGYGEKILENIIPSVVSVGGGIVSGGAYGIDTLSHEIAIKYGGYTVSVFGCGVDISYPTKNTQLFEKIILTGGALVSSFPIGTEPEPYHFPIRNEIVAGISDGIVIPEAGLKSGTLITANLALEHGRDVFAVPGDIFRETSAGTNFLISTGQAKGITGPEGILEEYFPSVGQTVMSVISEKEFDSQEQKDIYRAIQDGFNTPDLIGQNTHYTFDVIIVTLSLLEINADIRIGKSGKYETT